MSAELVRAGTVEELRTAGRRVIGIGGRPVLVIHDGERFFAVDNRCPHLGFPLEKGDVHDGLIDCHWHHARFDLSCGATLDPWADDVDSYRVEVRDGQVFVDPRRAVRDPEAHGLSRLDRGLTDDLRLVVAKAVLEMSHAGVEPDPAIAAGARFGATRREDGWAPGLSILTAMANMLPALDETDRPRALIHALAHIAEDCAGRPPRRPRPDLVGTDRPLAGLVAWFRETVEVRDTAGSERILASIVAVHGPRAALHAVLAAVTDHRYSDGGHALDYAVKCAELAERLGDRFGRDLPSLLFTSLVPSLTGMERMEETSTWRRPIDVAALVGDASKDLPEEAFQNPADEALSDEDTLVELLLEGPPDSAVDGLVGRLRAGASPISLAEAVVSAATRRVLRFGAANEVSDWNTVHHTLTYANAVAEGMRRAPSRELFRAVLDGAMSVYLDRFLNVPPADPFRRSDENEAPKEWRRRLLTAYDRRSSVDEAARIAVGFLSGGGNPGDLLASLGAAVLREDAGFHAFQQLDIAWRRLQRRGPGPETDRALVACSRWIAAPFPTPRAREQTFHIASRLARGDHLHEASEPALDD